MIRDFRRLVPYLARHRLQLAVGAACLVATNWMDVQLATLMGAGLDLIGLRMGAFAAAQKGLLILWAGMVVATALGSGAARFWMRWLIIGVSRDVEFEFRNAFFARLLDLPPPFYDRARTGDVMSRATSDMEAIRTVIGPCIMYLANTSVQVPMTVTKMVLISPALAAACWLPMALLMPLVFFFKRRINARFRRVQELMSDLSANVQEAFSGVRVIKTHAREAERAEAFDKVSSDYVTANLRLARLQSVFMPMLGVIIGLSILVMIATGSVMIIHGRLSIGSLMTFFLLLGQSVWPVASLGWVLAQMERGAASMARVDEIMNLPEHDAPEEMLIDDAGQRTQARNAEAGTRNEATGVARGAPAIVRLRGAIELRGLTFSYAGATRPALRGLTLTIPEGSTLGVTGPVGCGKSTLAHLLTRRYDPPRGTLLIDGRDALDWPVAALRRQIGVIDQEPFLFSDAIAANILFGVDGVDASVHSGWRALPPALQERMLSAARVARVDEEIRAFPGDFDALLGERGINLSGGQRQRVALARALARDPALLILDDALAAVDAQTESAILRGLREVLGSRTTLLISHRVSTMQLSDSILYLEDGAMTETGSHEELLALQGKYWRLAERQRLAEEIESTE